MHMRHGDSGVVGTSAVIGGNPPHAVGYALADKVQKREQVSVTFFGDGAAQNGGTYEAMNIAAAQRLPVIFFIENIHELLACEVPVCHFCYLDGLDEVF